MIYNLQQMLQFTFLLTWQLLKLCCHLNESGLDIDEDIDFTT